MNININDFLDKFNENYNFLYINNDNVAGYSDALEYGENFIKEHIDFIQEFNKFRDDILSSDREIVAFAFTLLDFEQ